MQFSNLSFEGKLTVWDRWTSTTSKMQLTSKLEIRNMFPPNWNCRTAMVSFRVVELYLVHNTPFRIDLLLTEPALTFKATMERTTKPITTDRTPTKVKNTKIPTTILISQAITRTTELHTTPMVLKTNSSKATWFPSINDLSIATINDYRYFSSYIDKY